MSMTLFIKKNAVFEFEYGEHVRKRRTHMLVSCNA